MKSRDKEALQKILGVIAETEEIIKFISLEEFLEKPLYKMAMTMSILRIGELVKNLTMEFRDLNPQVRWKGITGTQNS